MYSQNFFRSFYDKKLRKGTLSGKSEPKMLLSLSLKVAKNEFLSFQEKKITIFSSKIAEILNRKTPTKIGAANPLLWKLCLLSK